ncbi:hypothetical protein ACSBR2_014094 [Camellia fascicularis]
MSPSQTSNHSLLISHYDPPLEHYPQSSTTSKPTPKRTKLMFPPPPPHPRRTLDLEGPLSHSLIQQTLLRLGFLVPRIWLILLENGNTLVKLEGDIDQGVEYYKKALYYNWHYADAMYNLGVAYGEMLKFDMEIVFYELAFHFNPHCAEACNNLGVIYKDCDNLDKVVECYQLALSIKPNFSQSLNNLGVVYTVQGKMDAVASMIEKAIVANPTYAEAYNNLVIINLQNLHCRTKGCEDPIQR